MENKKREFTQEFNKEAVGYSLASEKTTKELARDLGISVSNLIRWITQYKKRGELAFSGHGKESLTPQNRKLENYRKNLPISR